MLKDIEFTGPYEISMHKVLWAENELALARCLLFKHDIETQKILCDLTVTDQTSILEFLKESFNKVWTHPTEHHFKLKLTAQVQAAYSAMWLLFTEQVLPKLPYAEKLYSHQVDTLFKSVKKQYNLYALEQGLGKTLIAGSMSRMLGIRRTMIITPASLKHNWLKELCGPISQFNEMYFTILDANKARTIKAFQERFVICNFDSIEKHLAHILSLPVDHIIIDECVAVKSTSTIRYKMVQKIVDANPQAKVTLLSGTPVRNRVNDLFAYLKLTKHPLGDNYAHFLREFTISSKGRGDTIKITGAKQTDVLWRQISNFMIRKRKDECLDLPPKIYGRLHFGLDDYKEEYEKAVKEALEKSGKTNLTSCIHSINIVTSKAKLKGVIEFAESIIDQGEKVVIFTGYTEIITALEDHFANRCVMINGKVHSQERMNRVDRFMQDDDCMVFLGNVLAAGTGITLTKSSNMIFCDFPLSPADLVQAEDRIHRIGQNNTVNIYYAVAIGSIDEQLHSLITDKAHDAARVIDNHTGTMESENIQEVLISKLREQYGKAEVRQDQQEESREPAASNGSEPEVVYPFR